MIEVPEKIKFSRSVHGQGRVTILYADGEKNGMHWSASGAVFEEDEYVVVCRLWVSDRTFDFNISALRADLLDVAEEIFSALLWSAARAHELKQERGYKGIFA